MGGSVDRSTLLAFAAIVILGGVNGTAIKIGSAELDPFWAATLRFGLASLIFFGLAAIRRVPLPRGRRLVGSALYGLLAFGVTFGLVNWGLVNAPAGMAQVILALVPLLTLLLAVAQGIERFRVQSAAGSLLAIVGVGLVFWERLGSSVPLLSMLAILAAAFSISESNVVVKRFPRMDPTANNAVAMGVGSLMLLAISLIAGEQLLVPTRMETWLSLGYLVVVGSVIVFTLFLYVISRWTASATSYGLLLMPLVAVAVAAALLGEAITPAIVAGGALVIVGVYLGAFAPSFKRPLPGLLRHEAPQTATATVLAPADGPPTLASPNCP